MKISFDDQTLELIPAGSGKAYRAALGGETAEVEILHLQTGQLELIFNGQRVTAYVSAEGSKRWVTINGRTFLLTRAEAGARRASHSHHHAVGELTAPMPGQVRAVNVSEGEAVTKGQTLMVLEAMKMEIRIQSPQAGTVRRLFVKPGQTVDREQILVEVGE